MTEIEIEQLKAEIERLQVQIESRDETIFLMKAENLEGQVLELSNAASNLVDARDHERKRAEAWRDAANLLDERLQYHMDLTGDSSGKKELACWDALEAARQLDQAAPRDSSGQGGE
tara:strand:+ start:4417 stop:4767 length:351 start_codon:yes stop_codon:yes gene_type:complete